MNPSSRRSNGCGSQLGLVGGIWLVKLASINLISAIPYIISDTGVIYIVRL